MEELEAAVSERFKLDAALWDSLLASKVAKSELSDLKLIRKAATAGIAPLLAKRKSKEGRSELLDLLKCFCECGPSAVLKTGGQRGGDFLLNQLHGRWAEDVCRSIGWDGQTLLAYGPSGAAMPGDEDHKQTVRTYRLITLLEGKRPDLLAMPTKGYEAMSSEERAVINEWQRRPLEKADLDALSGCTCGIEVKSSAWHYETRRESGRGPLSVTVKEEETNDINAWEQRHQLPVLFFQVLFDEVYCLGFKKMQAAIANGFLRSTGDYELVRERESNKKVHRFYIGENWEPIAKVTYPDKSEAVIKTLPDGSVIPYIKFSPAETSVVRQDLIERELQESLSL